jgi:hypothetical protein
MPVRSSLVALSVLALAACREPAPSPGPDAPAPGPEAPAPAVIAAEDLAALLPSQVGDMARGAVVAEQDGAMGLTVSRAEATYGTGPQAVTLLVLDVGSAEGATLMGLAAPPTEAGVSMLVGGRYFVEASGARVGLDLLDVYVRSVNLSALPGGA